MSQISDSPYHRNMGLMASESSLLLELLWQATPVCVPTASTPLACCHSRPPRPMGSNPIFARLPAEIRQQILITVFGNQVIHRHAGQPSRRKLCTVCHEHCLPHRWRCGQELANRSPRCRQHVCLSAVAEPAARRGHGGRHHQSHVYVAPLPHFLKRSEGKVLTRLVQGPRSQPQRS